MKTSKFTSTVSGAAIFIAVVSILSKGLGFLREILFAGIYGLSTEFDIYLIGAVIPLTINTIILCIGQNYFIPTYNKAKSDNTINLNVFVRTNFYLFIVAGLVLALILYMNRENILDLFLGGSEQNIIQTTNHVFILFLLSIPITAGISILIGYQQSNHEFRYSIISNIIPNITVLFFVYFWGSDMIVAIPIGFIVGNLIQISYLMFSSKELFTKVNASISQLTLLLKSSLSSILIVVLIESIGQLYLISDRLFYESITEGGISALSYAQTIFFLPISILTISLSTAIFPKFSILYQEKKKEELERIFSTGILISVGIFVPIMILFIFYGDTITKIFFERGKFSFIDTVKTSDVLSYYAFGIIFYSIYGVINKLLYSIGMIKKLLLITIIGIVLKIILNIILVEQYEQNGLAVSTTLSYLFFFVTSFFIVNKNILNSKRKVFIPNLVYYSVNALAAFIFTKIFVQFMQAFHIGTFYEIIIFITVYSTNLFIVKSNLLNIFSSIINNFSMSYKS
ncbi:MAG: polysaccharide biosynthesis C-terminal domain-containing protein [Ignavibacteriales bacterium]|nr:MAG: polysaccharide biosynthesis C-terminal domain-containing protein [Ignavibacteriales bacterium]